MRTSDHTLKFYRGALGDCRDPFYVTGNSTTLEHKSQGVKTIPCASGWCNKILEDVDKSSALGAYIIHYILKSIFYKKVHKKIWWRQKLLPVSALFQWGNFVQIFASTKFLCIFMDFRIDILQEFC